jgi:DNA-binding transcriptional regulator GbsR (MarR family)
LRPRHNGPNRREPLARATTDPSTDEATRRFIEDFALLLTEGGVPRMPARVFACVLADDAGKLTAGELADRLGVSPAAVSGAVRYLVQVGLLAKIREPGERRDHYGLKSDPWYEIYGDRDTLLRRWEEKLAEGVEILGPDRPASRRLRETQEFFAFNRSMLAEIMERWHEHKRRVGLDGD